MVARRKLFFAACFFLAFPTLLGLVGLAWYSYLSPEARIEALINRLAYDPSDPQSAGKCQTAFDRLSNYGETALPYLVKHLGDKRESIDFRNHFIGGTVGSACYWSVYFQLQDEPSDYSSYGHGRYGKDGKAHVQPYWDAAPFDEPGHYFDTSCLVTWLDHNKALSYTEMQIKCLKWLLDREKSIGCPDTDSYFTDVLPLEIRIRQRELQLGKNVSQELNRLREIKAKKLVDAIPPELLPSK